MIYALMALAAARAAAAVHAWMVWLIVNDRNGRGVTPSGFVTRQRSGFVIHLMCV